MIRQVSSADAARWLKRAEKLSRDAERKGGIKREIIDGYIVEGTSLGRLRRARVIDPPGAINVVGAGPVRDTENPDAAPVLRPVPAYSFLRHYLSTKYSTPETRRSASVAFGHSRYSTANLHAADNTMQRYVHPSGSFTHGVHERPDGYRVLGQTYSSDPACRYYSPQEAPITYWFSFGVVHSGPNTRVVNGEDQATFSGVRALGLDVDSTWIESYLGSGARIVAEEHLRDGDWREPNYTVSGNPFFDSRGGRWLHPWMVGIPIDLTPDRIVWRLLTRYRTPRLSDNDPWGVWCLATFDVAVERNELGVITATPSGLVRYDPRSSPTAERRPAEEPVGFVGQTFMNSAGYPCLGAAGTAVVPMVVVPDLDPDIRYEYNMVVLRADQTFVELDTLPGGLSAEMGTGNVSNGKLRSLFFGSDTVDGVPYHVNPFIAPGVLAVVNGVTGAAQLISRPTFFIPGALDLLPGQQQNRMFYTDDQCKNMVAHIGEARLAFPVATDTTETAMELALAVYDIPAGTVAVRGVSKPIAEGISAWRHIAKPSSAQFEIDATSTTQATPGAILWGYGGGGPGGLLSEEPPASGELLLSVDSGVTWTTINNTVGAWRAVWYGGSPTHNALPGQLWEPRSTAWTT